MLTTYFANCIMGNVFQTKTDPVLPTVFYLGVSSTTPAEDGSNVTEPVGGGYSRVPLTSFSEPADGMILNEADVELPESTGDWGTMTHYVVYDAETEGNLLMYQALESPRVVQVNTQARFKVNTLKFTLKNVEQ